MLIIGILIILFAIFMMIVFLVLSIVFFVKQKKILGFIFLGLLLFVPLSLYILFLGIVESTKPSSMSEYEINSALKYQNIKLKNDFEILSSEGQSDLTYFRNEFKLKLSEEDYKIMSNEKSDTLVNIKKKNGLTYDTIKIIINKDRVLDFYRSQHDFNN